MNIFEDERSVRLFNIAVLLVMRCFVKRPVAQLQDLQQAVDLRNVCPVQRYHIEHVVIIVIGVFANILSALHFRLLAVDLGRCLGTL